MAHLLPEREIGHGVRLPRLADLAGASGERWSARPLESVPVPTDPLARVAELPGVPEAVAETRDAADRLLRHRMLRGPRSVVSRLSAESALRGARSSAALDGEDVPLERLRGDDAAPPDTPVLQGALRVNGALPGLIDTWHRAPGQVLARLHTLAAAGLAGPERLGRPRSGPPAPDTGPAAAPPAPDAGEVAARLGLLAELLTTRSNPPAAVLAAVVHGELLVLRPFGLADGVVARAAQRLTLMTCGLDSKGLTMPEVGHLEQRGDYAAALRGYAAGTRDGVARWILHCASAISLGARESLAVCEAWQRGT
jgi:hypothetical protein